MGKPYQVTYEYAANKIQKQAGDKKIKKFFMIGWVVREKLKSYFDFKILYLYLIIPYYIKYIT